VQQIVNYWVQIENDSKGPFTKQQLRAMLEKGALSPRHLAAPKEVPIGFPSSFFFPRPTRRRRIHCQRTCRHERHSSAFLFFS
jgi:hypothetical protein